MTLPSPPCDMMGFRGDDGVGMNAAVPPPVTRRMKPRSTRRAFLELSLAGTALIVIGCEADEPAAACRSVGPAAAAPEPATPDEVEAIAAWILAASDADLVPQLRERLDSVWTMDAVFAGLLLAGSRTVNPLYGGGNFHSVLQVAALRSITARSAERDVLTPLVYGLLRTRASVGMPDFELPTADLSQLPPAAGADGRLVAAVEAGSVDDALREVTALTRSGDVSLLHDTLLDLGSRRAHKLGHEAICAAKVLRVLVDLPGAWSEDVYRAVIYAYMTVEAPSGPEHSEIWQASRAKVIEIPPTWSAGADDPTAIPSIAAELRGVTEPLDAVSVVEGHLQRGLSPHSIWDALVVSSAESVFAGNNYHALTSVQALRDAYGLASRAETRLLSLLQAAAFVPLMGPSARDVSLLDTVTATATLDDVFETAGLESIVRALGYFEHGGEPEAFVDRMLELARSRVFDEHHYKIPHAAIQEAERLPCAYQRYVLAVARGYAPSTGDPVHPAFTLTHDP